MHASNKSSHSTKSFQMRKKEALTKPHNLASKEGEYGDVASFLEPGVILEKNLNILRILSII